MSGQAAIRGFLLQALTALLESLRDPTWITVCVEPDEGDEKVDILWGFSSKRRACQVKQRTDPISLAEATQWAQALKLKMPADDLSLLLLGSPTRELARTPEIESVKVAFPAALDFGILTSSAAHRLSIFMEGEGLSAVPGVIRELVAQGLATRILEFSAQQRTLARAEFGEIIRSWLLAAYPSAVVDNAAAMRVRHERELEVLRNDLRAHDRVSSAHFSLKYQACLDALSVIDAVQSHFAWNSGGQPLRVKKQRVSTAMARECMNRLSITCRDPNLPRLFMHTIMGKDLANNHLKGDAINALRNAIRAELGFGETLDLDGDLAWIGYLDGDEESVAVSWTQRE